MSNNIKYLEQKSLEYRKTTLEIIYNSGAGHTGGSLSCLDILNVLYNNILGITPENFSSSNRNQYIHSKGHSVEALYAVLCDKGFFSKSDSSIESGADTIICSIIGKVDNASCPQTFLFIGTSLQPLTSNPCFLN